MECAKLAAAGSSWNRICREEPASCCHRTEGPILGLAVINSAISKFLKGIAHLIVSWCVKALGNVGGCSDFELQQGSAALKLKERHYTCKTTPGAC